MSKTVIISVSVAVVVFTAYIIILSFSKIIKVIEKQDIILMTRLRRLIVMVIPVEFYFSGLKPIIQ